MTAKKPEQKSGLSTTSFVLSIVGLLFALTVIGAFLGVPLAILGLIFGIIALVKKQKKGMAIAGVVIGGIVTLITIAIITVATIFIKRNADIIIDPIIEMSEMIENDPVLAEMMGNPIVQEEFERTLVERLTVTFAEEIKAEDKDKTRDEIKPMIPVIFDEMTNVMLELKEKYEEE